MTTVDLELLPVMERALDDQALVLHFQPEIDLTSGAVVAMEALLRWQHPGRGLLWPADFLPVAEATGLVVDFDDWVLRTCVAELAAWQTAVSARNDPYQLWINISAAELSQPDFVGRVSRLLSDAGLPAGALGLEITEEALTNRGRDAATVLQELRDAGVALAIDDFGTWYSSLATLGELPIDAVKLDRSFVRGVGSDLDEDNIVASVIRLAHARDLYVVAEGVESWTEGARLCELGCDRAHGYLFAGPQRADEARRMLSKQTGWHAPGLIPQARSG
ncbi:MAG TPA: EAL domain-containing protein [Mycobacteriales bacterium]|nr:EAL domain-containing protein [Mycobacteriales bacterium]